LNPLRLPFRHARVEFARVIGVTERVYTGLAHKV